MAMTNVMTFTLRLDYRLKKTLLGAPHEAHCPVVAPSLSAD